MVVVVVGPVREMREVVKKYITQQKEIIKVM